MKSGFTRWVWGGVLALALPTLSLAQSPTPQRSGASVSSATALGLPATRDYRPPRGITFKPTNFFSENVRLTAQWFYAAENEGRKLPAVIMASDWGSTAVDFRESAVDLARAGYLVMLFDYRGWGDSDGRVVPVGPQPVASGGTFTARIRELRGYIDPWEQNEDWFNAISYAAASPGVDADRIGIFGAGFSGGHILYVAAHEPRVKALASLVTNVDARPYKPYQLEPDKAIANANTQASRIANGQAPYPPDQENVDGLIGAPVGNKLLRWAPVELTNRVSAPALFVLAEKEERFSNLSNGQLACDRVQGPRKMVILSEITHDGVYGAARNQAVTAAVDWFDRYLKGPGATTRVPINEKEPERGECDTPPLPPMGEENDSGFEEAPKAQNTPTRFN